MLLGAGGEGVGCGHDPGDQVVGGEVAAPAQDLDQRVFAPFLVPRVHALRDPVGEAEEHVALADVDGPFSEGCDVHQADDRPARLQPFDPSVLAEEDRGVVAGVHVREDAVAILAIEEGGVAVRGRRLEDQFVDVGHQPGEVAAAHQGLPAERGLKPGHEESGGNALARDVADGEADRALALDNTRLVEQVATEVAKRERLTREIEIAREVQFTLLPQTMPVIPGLDFGGHCRPAAGIGGDYYDFIPLEGERAIGLAIGDIAGKGIPAALLMAGLQAALRGQALAGSRDLPRLMVNINKLIFESSPSNRYATFFYGEYRNGAFTYVNAGHNAPMLLREDGRIERLEVGGSVIGMMDFAAFALGSVPIAPGDVLLGFTDGVSECMNPRDEEWGDDRLAEVLRENRDCPAALLVTRIMTAADAFAAGAKQHDDMTLILMKVVG